MNIKPRVVWELVFFFIASAVLCFSQGTTTLTGTVTDSDSQTWNLGTWTATLYNPYGGQPINIYTGQPVPGLVSGTLTSNGALQGSNQITSTAAIVPNGTLWSFKFCSLTSAPCVTLPNVTVPNTTYNLGTYASNNIVAPRFRALSGAYGYLNAEVLSPTVGNQYLNVTSNDLCYYLSSWTCTSAGVGEILPGTGISVSPDPGVGNVTISNTGVTQIVAGTNVTISPTNGQGIVTVNASAVPGSYVSLTDTSLQTMAGPLGFPSSISGVTPYYDPRYYGAMCNGTATDDHVAFAAMMTALCAAGGGQVLLPPSTCYQGSTSLTINCGNVTIRGTGNNANNTISGVSTLLFAAGTSGIVTNPAVRTNGLDLENFDVLSQSTGSGSDFGVRISSSNTSKVERVQVQGFGAGCFYWDNSGTGAQNNDNFWLAIQNYAYGCHGDSYEWNGVGSSNVNSGQAIGNISVGAGAYGFHLIDANTNTFIGNSDTSSTNGSYFISDSLSNLFQANYAEAGGTMTFDSTTSWNKVWSPDFGGPTITDSSGGSNDIQYPITASGQVYGGQIAVGPKAGSAGTDAYAWRADQYNNGDFDLYDSTTSTEWLDANKGANTFYVLKALGAVAGIAGATPISTFTLGATTTVGSGATAACDAGYVCDEISGTISLTTGTGTTTAQFNNPALTITFPVTRGNSPNCFIQTIDNSSGGLINTIWPNSTASTLAFNLQTTTTFGDNTTYIMHYICGGS